MKKAKTSLFQEKWLPWAIGILGTIIVIVLWYAFVSGEHVHQETTATYKMKLRWAALIAGVAIALLIALSIRLAQQAHEKTASLAHMEAEFKKEIIERIKAEGSKRKLEIALLQGQKLQAIGTLAGGIAHDFNNLLYAIIGYVEMARDDVGKETLTYSNLGKVLEAAKRGQDLVSRILAFGRRHQHLAMQPLNVAEVLENVLSLLKPTIPASVIIDLIGMSDKFIILGDQTQLHQVIVNIINNAVDAMNSEGTITIQLSLVHAKDPYLQQFPHIKPINYCKIDIKDTGHGMDDSTQARIFEPFYTTKEVGKGTGLGLSTVHAIIDEHQGEITVVSLLGQGTTFTLLLPIYTEENSYGDNSFGRR